MRDVLGLIGIVVGFFLLYLLGFLAVAGISVFLLGRYTPFHPSFKEMVVYIIVAQFVFALISSPSSNSNN